MSVIAWMDGPAEASAPILTARHRRKQGDAVTGTERMIPRHEFIIHRDAEILNREAELVGGIQLRIECCRGFRGALDFLLGQAAALHEEAEIADGERVHGVMAVAQSSGVLALSSARPVTGSSRRQSFRIRILRGQRKSSACAFSNTGSDSLA